MFTIEVYRFLSKYLDLSQKTPRISRATSEKYFQVGIKILKNVLNLL